MPLCWKSSVSASITKSGEEQQRNNVATALGFGGSCSPCSPSLNLQVQLDGLVLRLGLRVIKPVSRVPSRLLKPQGAGPFRGAACHRWPAAAATRTWGRVRGAGTGPPASSGWGVPGARARGSPEQGYKNAARAPRRVDWTVSQLSSHVARPPVPAPRLRYGPQPVALRCLRPASVAWLMPLCLSPFSCSLQPGASDGDAGGDGGLLRDG